MHYRLDYIEGHPLYKEPYVFNSLDDKTARETIRKYLQIIGRLTKAEFHEKGAIQLSQFATNKPVFPLRR